MILLKYERVALEVEAVILQDGSFRLKRLYYDDIAYDISSTLRVCKFCPRGVPCIAPTEYTVKIGKSIKNLYFEKDTNTWFSVREKQDNEILQ